MNHRNFKEKKENLVLSTFWIGYIVCAVFLFGNSNQFFAESLPISKSKITTHNPSRVISLNGSITEIIYALGKESLLVGIDTSSYYPDRTNLLPKVGYQRTLSLEGILSLQPDLVLGTDEAGPVEVLDRLKKMNVSLEIHKAIPGLDSTLSRIRWVGKNLGSIEASESIAHRIQKNVNHYKNNLPWKNKPRVLMVYSRGKNMILVAGNKTTGSAIIELAGAENYIDEFDGYKPLTPEILLMKKADIILLTSMSLKSLGTLEEVWKLPGFNAIPSNNRPKIVTMDDLLLLGFSTRLDEAVYELQKNIQNSLR